MNDDIVILVIAMMIMMKNCESIKRCNVEENVKYIEKIRKMYSQETTRPQNAKQDVETTK